MRLSAPLHGKPVELDNSELHSRLMAIEHDPGLDFLQRHASVQALLRERIMLTSKYLDKEHISDALQAYKYLEACCHSRRQWGQQSGCLLYIALAYRRTGDKQLALRNIQQAHKLASEQDDEYLGSILATLSSDELTGELGTSPERGRTSITIGIELGKLALSHLHKQSLKELDWNTEPFCKIYRRDKVNFC